MLSDRDIRSGEFVSITPFSERNLTPNGYDLTIAEVLVGEPGSGERVAGDGEAVVPPMGRFMVSTLEYLEMGDNVIGELWLRTTWARRGVLASFGMVDAGFHGNLTLAAFNTSSLPLHLPIGERFAQIVFLPLTSRAEKPYSRRSGRYHGQRGVTPARD
ncbi:MAG: dCTP deaminase [Thermoplasmata archaeon]|nr:dCTP deaminase [Thermoplasmata archaeon]